jgi:hypothetical protein
LLLRGAGTGNPLLRASVMPSFSPRKIGDLRAHQPG